MSDVYEHIDHHISQSKQEWYRPLILVAKQVSVSTGFIDSQPFSPIDILACMRDRIDKVYFDPSVFPPSLDGKIDVKCVSVKDLVKYIQTSSNEW